MHNLMLTEHIQKKVWWKWAILNKSWKQSPQNNGCKVTYPTPISKTFQVRWIRHVGHYWRSKDKLINDILIWTSTHERASVGWPAWTYLHQLHMNTASNLEDPLWVMDEERASLGKLYYQYNLMMIKFNISSAFYWFILTKNKNLYSLHDVLNEKIWTVFKGTDGYVHTKVQ